MTKIPPKRCDEIDRLVYDVHMDYCITSFPIDEKRLVSEMGFILIRYSKLSKKDKKMMEDIIQTGVHLCSRKKGYPIYMIAYNDDTEPGRAKLTVLHEIGHILLGHGSNPTPLQEAEADYFAKQMAAPRCLLRFKGHTTTSDIRKFYGLSRDASEWTVIALDHMASKFGDAILENDRAYIEWVRRCAEDN